MAVRLSEPSPEAASAAVRGCGERSLELLRAASYGELFRLGQQAAFESLVRLMPGAACATLMVDGAIQFCVPGEPEVHVLRRALTPRFGRLLLAEEVMFHVS